LTDARFYAVLAVVGLVIGGCSLLIPSTPSYDPWAWLVWGREIIHLNLHTTGGPTWKPLPMIFTTFFALFGKSAAPDMWLVVARAGAVAAAVMVFKVAARFTWMLSDRAGIGDRSGSTAQRIAAASPAVLAGVIAALGLIFSSAFITDNAYGYSEGLMTALVLIALERHVDGHQRQAFIFGFFAALDRPEIWLFWGPYGLWLFWKDPGARKLVVGLFVLIPILWFLPEYWGSGHFFRGVSRANHPRSNSPAFAKCPFCTEFRNAWITVLSRIKIAALIAVAAAAGLLGLARITGREPGGRIGAERNLNPMRWSWKFADQRERAMFYTGLAALAGIAWWVVIAVLTQAGFSGNNRYLVLGAALIEVTGGVAFGWAAIELARWRRRLMERTVGEEAINRFPLLSGYAPTVLLLALVFAFIPGFVGNSMTDIQRTHRSLVYQAHLRQDLSAVIAKFGGAKRILACGSVMTEGFQVPMAAYALDERTLLVLDEPNPVLRVPPSQAYPGPGPSTILQTRAQSNASLLPSPTAVRDWQHNGTPYTTYIHVRSFRLFSRCPAKVTG
jgi:hypothetical protein